MKQKTGRKLLSFLLTLAMVVGLLPGMGLTAYAAGGGTEVTKANVICQQYSYMDAGYYGDSGYRTPPVEITNITLADAQAFGAAVTCPTTYWVVVYAKDGDNLKWTLNGKTGEQTSTPDRISTWSRLYNGDVFHFGGNYDPTRDVTFYFSKGLATVSVTGVSLDKTTAQTIDVDGKVSFTATVAPDNATDKKVKWNVGGTDTGAVKLYSDEACTTEVGADAIETLTVYAKGISAGSATVTATSNADSEKKASCDVTVNAAQTPTETLLTTITPTGKTTHSATVDGVVTVSHNNDYYDGQYGWLWYDAVDTLTVSGCEGYTITKCIFKQNAKNPVTDSSAPFELHFDSVGQWGGVQCRENFEFDGVTSIEVYGYATPTATHSVTITPGDNMTKTDASGAESQTDLSGEMIDVVYTADDGYYFPEDYSVEEVNGITVTRNSYTQITVSGTPTADAEITLIAPTAKTTPDAPTTAAATDCTTADNNDGKLTSVTTAMEYKKSDAADWTAGTGSDITGLVPGTYYVRVKATETTNASTNQELTIKGFISYTVTFKVVNGKWNEGEGDAATADKTVTLTGHDGDTLKLTADQIPAVGTKPNDTYKAGSWDVTPSTNTAITAATTYTYTYVAKEAAAVTKEPEGKTLTYNGQEQALVTAGTATGGTMQYVLGTATEATQPYTTSIPTATNAGSYYVWYKAVGDETHTDSEAKCIAVTISSESSGGSGGSSSSGGGSSTPSTPTTPTESYTVPVSSENTVNVTTNISNGTAVVSEITQSDIDKIVDNGNNSGGGDNTGASENTSITIDVSQAKSEVTSVQLSEKTVEKLTEAVKADNNVESVKIKMTNATIELDGAALSAVSEQAEGSSIKLVVEDTQTTKLNATQQESLKQFASAKPFQAYFESNGKEIHDFKGGKATVSIKFTPESGRDVKHYHMYYLPVAGAIERYVTRYVDGMLSFVTTHFSDYAIVYDETMENETGKDDGTGGGSSETGGESNGNTDGAGTDSESENGSQTDSSSGNTANGKTSYQNALSINKGLKVSQTGNKITVSWGKVSGANRYEIYVAYCTDKFGKKPVKIITKKDVTSVTITKLNGKKLVLTKNFKAYVVAYKTVDGSKKKLGKTITAHIVGRKNKTYTNVKAIKLAKNKATIKVGKTYKIKASVVLVDSKKKMLSDKHAATFRYASSDKKIATVDKNGKVTAKKVGTCYIWVYAKNGYAKKVKITVK